MALIGFRRNITDSVNIYRKPREQVLGVLGPAGKWAGLEWAASVGMHGVPTSDQKQGRLGQASEPPSRLEQTQKAGCHHLIQKVWVEG